ncbi:MAG: HAMP domain-containing protein, partial [Bryobacteraceae bacterium]
MLGQRIRNLSRGLRFRLTLSYALFFTLLLAVAGVAFHGYLIYSLDRSMRDVLDNEWAAMKGYLKISKGKADWMFDQNDEEERFIVGRLRRVYLLANAKGEVLEYSEWYDWIGVDPPEAIRQMVQTAMKDPKIAFWRTSRDSDGDPFLIRAGVVFADDKVHEPYFVAIGRSLKQNEDILRGFTRPFVFLTTIVILAGGWLGWLLAGRALRPVAEVTRAAARISGSNFSLRIPNRGAEDELDYLIDTFNRMIER